MYEFDCPTPIALSLRIAGGEADIIAEDRPTAVVEVDPADGSDASRDAAGRTRVEMQDGTLVIDAPEWTGWQFRRGPRVRVTVRLPHDGDLQVKVAAADVRAAGRYASATLNSGSGDLSVQHVSGAASVNTASGDARVERVDGELRVNTASGDLSVGQVGGEFRAHSASGDIEVGRATGSVRVTTASGDVLAGTVSTGTVQINAVSGDVSVGVAPGIGVWLDLSSVSGDTRSDLAMPDGDADPAAATLTLQVRTVSGDIDVHRSAMAATTG
jgi:hypothetical protein